MPKDPLDERIETLRREVADAHAQLESLEAKLRIYEDAASLRPSSVSSLRRMAVIDDIGHAPHRGGRQLGAISKKWRQILRHIVVQCPNGAAPDVIASFGRAVGLPNLRASDVRIQAKKYSNLGYLEQIGDDDLFRVTKLACERFEFRSAQASMPPPNSAEVGSEENQTPFTPDARMAAE
jgi:hypothetical protein